MHMMSKEELSSDELDTLRRSRNPTVVLAANGEVHTHLGNSSKSTDIPSSGSAVKSHG